MEITDYHILVTIMTLVIIYMILLLLEVNLSKKSKEITKTVKNIIIVITLCFVCSLIGSILTDNNEYVNSFYEHKDHFLYNDEMCADDMGSHHDSLICNINKSIERFENCYKNGCH